MINENNNIQVPDIAYEDFDIPEETFSNPEIPETHDNKNLHFDWKKNPKKPRNTTMYPNHSQYDL